MRMIRRGIATLISLLPFNWMRIAAYKIFLGYTIHKTHIGFGSVISVKHAELTACHIGKFCKFLGPMKAVIGQQSSIGNFTKVICGFWTLNLKDSGVSHTIPYN